MEVGQEGPKHGTLYMSKQNNIQEVDNPRCKITIKDDKILLKFYPCCAKNQKRKIHKQK